MFKFQFRCRATILGLVTAALLAGHAAHSLAADYATILMYHRFGEDRYPSTNVTLEQFEEHLEILASGPYNVMPLDDVVEHLQAGEPLPDRSVAITIDDAYLSVFKEAFCPNILLTEFAKTNHQRLSPRKRAHGQSPSPLRRGVEDRTPPNVSFGTTCFSGLVQSQNEQG